MEPGLWDFLKSVAIDNAALALAIGALYYVMNQSIKREREIAEECKGDKEILIATLNSNTKALTELSAVIRANGKSK
jgi:hypothetical protein